MIRVHLVVVCVVFIVVVIVEFVVIMLNNTNEIRMHTNTHTCAIVITTQKDANFELVKISK